MDQLDLAAQAQSKVHPADLVDPKDLLGQSDLKLLKVHPADQSGLKDRLDRLDRLDLKQLKAHPADQ